MHRTLAPLALVAALGLTACAHSLVADLDTLEGSLSGIEIMDSEHKLAADLSAARKAISEARQAYAGGQLAEAKALTATAQEKVNGAQAKQYGL
ncbi:MAG: hypothetical protein COW73_11970 [Nitrospirae bacterium CG18_big_fil_WC_8_21_14_2_50_70_55]|nr:hypothetical protein [Deltaproteobacteria bacterium]OIP63764.1 MAG: hypothetical protein AUK30_07785 [Nitrospirae bacterium CG2_30_70_394]PIQ03076.1 MAG: hypothetical protein COW73_11970 [Nitrospirae bacterium CG18_big_fil_WC_8_21_14_2_50_70_55]PIU77885.1 MAG: hypothetical protein COS73_08865 [Nitrospirae bacterium CG06_land_8_20_14_3_00_70_43]PIW83576.1 MAG: hypothetical protein COZ96_02800 [Nitrospirae bacterium CG_4_8_14_3_um_filter_70_85]PIX84107.1 MAG: hypothetical protein COZ33_01845 